MSKETKTPQPSEREYLKGILSYCQATGNLIWLKTNNQHCGRVAGKACTDRNGKTYIRVQVNRRRVYAHVIAWYLQTGDWIPGRIDHINGDGTDNRIENLREADVFENMKNKRRMKNNTSGFCGVIFHQRDQVWEARMNANGKRITIGSFKNK